jgi:hypothetical protein
LRKLGVDRLADVVIALGQRLAGLRLELGVGAQIVEELRQRALEADLLRTFSISPVIRATSLRPSWWISSGVSGSVVVDWTR